MNGVVSVMCDFREGVVFGWIGRFIFESFIRFIRVGTLVEN